MTAVVLTVLAGCEPTAGDRGPSHAEKELLTVDFRDGRTLRYKFVSSREITVGWDTSEEAAISGKRAAEKSSESMEMIVSYTPAEINPYGLTTVKATCESVKVAHSKGPGRDAAESFAGRTFTLAVGPTGKIEDYSQLDELTKDAGKKAFRANTDQGRIKEPDMINDFVASQWFLWDAVASIEEPSKGIAVGQSWRSKLSVPAPMVMRKARGRHLQARRNPAERARPARRDKQLVPPGGLGPARLADTVFRNVPGGRPLRILQKLSGPRFAGPGRGAVQYRRRQDRAMQAAVPAPAKGLFAAASCRCKSKDNNRPESDNDAP